LVKLLFSHVNLQQLINIVYNIPIPRKGCPCPPSCLGIRDMCQSKNVSGQHRGMREDLGGD
jgi:hypothetical protein